MAGADGTRTPLLVVGSDPDDRNQLGPASPPPAMPCFKCFRRIFSSVLSGFCICCNGYIRILQAYIYVASICFKCFRSFRYLFQVFHLDVAEVDLDVA
jgi:hypothetical protein